MKEVAFRRISTGSIFKIVFFGSWIGSLPVFLLFGILATFGVEIISWNEKYIIGPIALVGGPLLGLFFCHNTWRYFGIASSPWALDLFEVP